MGKLPSGGSFVCLNCAHIIGNKNARACPCGNRDLLAATSEDVRYLGKKKGRKKRLETLISLRREAGLPLDEIETDSWGRPARQVMLPTLNPKASTK